MGDTLEPRNMLHTRIRMRVAMLLATVLTMAACSAADSTATVGSSTTSANSVPTTAAASPDRPTTTLSPGVASTMPFSIEIGPQGVTYDLNGAPASGPSSFAVLDDGSVVVADTMAAARGEPRLIHYDRSGERLATIGLADAEVAAIVDVVTDGSQLAILEVLASQSRYRVLTLSTAGSIQTAVDIPPGFRFEDGLTGLAWDDSGVLLEFEFGARYARLIETGEIEQPVVPVFDETSIELVPGSGRTTEVVVGESRFTVERGTDLGGVTLVGIGPDGSVVVVVDEVDTSGPTISVLRRVRRYTPAGELEKESLIDVADQFLDIPRPLELDPTGAVLYLHARPDRVTIGPVED